MKPEIKELLLQLPRTSQGQALKVFLDEEFDKINDVTDIKTIEQAIGKQIAMQTLNKIFSFYYEQQQQGGQKKNNYV